MGPDFTKSERSSVNTVEVYKSSGIASEIEVRYFPVGAQSIEEHMLRANKTLLYTFGKGFDKGFIKRVVAGIRGPLGGGHGGRWIPNEKTLLIYSSGIYKMSDMYNRTEGFIWSDVNLSGISPGFIWKPVLNHELGHAYFTQLRPLQKMPPNSVASEAFAMFGAVVIGNNGNRQRIIDSLASVSNPTHSLFNYDLFRNYPKPNESWEDTPILYYIFSRYGLDTVLDIAQGLKVRPERSPFSPLDPVKSEEEWRRETEQAVWEHKQRHKRFQNEVKRMLGVNLRKLSLDSHQWYRENAKSSPLSPPTLAERLRSIKESLPLIGGKIQYPPLEAIT